MPRNIIPKVFISYSHKDEWYKNKLLIFLDPLKQANIISWWEAGQLTLGANYNLKIVQQISDSDIFILLVSPDSLSSDYIKEVELKKAYELFSQNKIIIAPIIIRPCNWEILKIKEFHVTPAGGEPISLKKDSDLAFKNAVDSIQKLVESILNLENQHSNFDIEKGQSVSLNEKYNQYLNLSKGMLRGVVKRIKIEDSKSLEFINIIVNYKIKHFKGREKIINSVLDFSTQENFKKGIHVFIKQFVEDYVKRFESTIEFFNKFYARKNNLLIEIKNNVEQELGLSMDVHIGIEDEDNLESLDMRDGFFEVFVKNYDRSLQIKYRAILDIHPEFKINAILKFRKQQGLKTVVRKGIQKVLLEKIDLEMFINNFELSKEKIIQNLNKILCPYGRKISYILFETETLIQDSEKEYQLDDFIVKYKLRDSSIDIKINLVLKLNDPGKYKSSPIKNIEEWVKDKLTKVTKNLYFGKTYLDLILSHKNNDEEAISDAAQKLLDEEAEKIGFKVQLLTTIPQVKPFELMNGFSFQVGEKANYITKNTSIKVKLIVSVTGTFIDLKKIEKYINPNIDIIDKMKEKVKLSVKEVIDKIEPERYYLRFNCADSKFDDFQSVEEELVEQISKKIKKEFHTNELTVIPKPLDTEITRRFAELKALFPQVDFEIYTLGKGKGGEKVKFKVRYLIESVDPPQWNQFQSRRFISYEEEEKQISAVLAEHLVNTFSTLKRELLLFKTHSNMVKLREIANLKVKPIISKTFGLNINLIFIGREIPNQS